MTQQAYRALVRVCDDELSKNIAQQQQRQQTCTNENQEKFLQLSFTFHSLSSGSLRSKQCLRFGRTRFRCLPDDSLKLYKFAGPIGTSCLAWMMTALLTKPLTFHLGAPLKWCAPSCVSQKLIILEAVCCSCMELWDLIKLCM